MITGREPWSRWKWWSHYLRSNRMKTVAISPSRATSPATIPAERVVNRNSPASVCFEWRICRRVLFTAIHIPVTIMMMDLLRIRGIPGMTCRSRNCAAARPRQIKEIPFSLLLCSRSCLRVQKQNLADHAWLNISLHIYTPNKIWIMSLNHYLNLKT